MVGDQELAEGAVNVRDLRTGEQQRVPLANVADVLLNGQLE
jgi:histidyl-tRNA synthetase